MIQFVVNTTDCIIFPKMKKADKTRKQIKDTFIKLTLKNNQIPNATEICQELDIYRSTFYNYFSSINDLIDSYGDEFTSFIDDIFDDIEKYRLKVNKNHERFSFAKVLTPWVNQLIIRSDEFAVFFNPKWNLKYRDYMAKKVYKTTLKILSITTNENRYIAEFISAGTVQYLYAHVANKEMFTADEFEKVWERVTLLVESK